MVFLDASAIICLLEGNPAARASVQEVLVALRGSEQPPPLAVSALSRLECRIRPLRDDNAELLERYDTFFEDPGLVVVPLENEVLDCAAQLRARYGLRTPDALQAGCLLAGDGAGAFVTGDTDFSRVSGLEVHAIRTS